MSPKSKIKVKVCGMKHPQNIQEVSALGPDYLGFIFYPRSARHCQDGGKEILKHIVGNAVPVMVSVDMSEEELIQIVDEWGFRVVQLHGNETPELCQRLRERGLEVWKAISIGGNIHYPENSCFDKTAPYEGVVDMFLFDTASKSYGGSGKKFDWHLLDEYKGSTPFMLSGGISSGDEEEILKLNHPMLAGVDLNSRFEISPGLKNINRLSAFISNLKR